MNKPPEVQKPAGPTAPIVARAGRYYRNARYLMFIIIVAMGVWFMYDGLVAYPASNRKYEDLRTQVAALEKDPKSDEATKISKRIQLHDMSFHEEFGILVQKILGCTLPPVGIGLLIYWMRKSRGEVRLEGGVLTLPGTPAVPLSTIDELDKELWDRKGIVTVYYTLDDNSTGKFGLDDFIYQAHPIRAIVKAIEDELQAQDEVLAQAEKSRLEMEKQLREQQEQEETKKSASGPAEVGNY